MRKILKEVRAAMKTKTNDKTDMTMMKRLSERRSTLCKY